MYDYKNKYNILYYNVEYFIFHILIISFTYNRIKKYYLFLILKLCVTKTNNTKLKLIYSYSNILGLNFFLGKTKKESYSFK